MAFILLLLWIGASIVIGKLAQVCYQYAYRPHIWCDSFCCSREVKMKPERIKRLFKAYLGIGVLFMLLVCIGIVVLLCL